MWLVETALCPLTPLCCCEMPAQIDLIYIGRLDSLRVPPSRTFWKERNRDLYLQGLRRESTGGKLNYDLRIIPLAPLGRCHHVCQSLLVRKKRIKISLYLLSTEGSKQREEKGGLIRHRSFQQKLFSLCFVTTDWQGLWAPSRAWQFINHCSLARSFISPPSVLQVLHLMYMPWLLHL